MEPTLLALTVLVFFVAGTLKGVVGIGLPTIGIGITTLYLDPRAAIALLLMPLLLSNMWQVWRLGQVWPALRRYAPFAVVMMAGIWVATGYAARAPVEVLLGVTGAAFVLFSVSNLAFTPPALPERWDRAAQVIGGAAAGALGGLTAIWSPPIAIYLAARRASPDDFMRATGLLFLLGAVPLLGGYARAGLFTGVEAAISLGLVVPVILGFSLGERLRARLPAEGFRNLLMWVFLGLGLNLIRRALMG